MDSSTSREGATRITIYYIKIRTARDETQRYNIDSRSRTHVRHAARRGRAFRDGGISGGIEPSTRPLRPPPGAPTAHWQPDASGCLDFARTAASIRHHHRWVGCRGRGTPPCLTHRTQSCVCPNATCPLPPTPTPAATRPKCTTLPNVDTSRYLEMAAWWKQWRPPPPITDCEVPPQPPLPPRLLSSCASQRPRSKCYATRPPGERAHVKNCERALSWPFSLTNISKYW